MSLERVFFQLCPWHEVSLIRGSIVLQLSVTHRVCVEDAQDLITAVALQAGAARYVTHVSMH